MGRHETIETMDPIIRRFTPRLVAITEQEAALGASLRPPYRTFDVSVGNTAFQLRGIRPRQGAAPGVRVNATFGNQPVVFVVPEGLIDAIFTAVGVADDWRSYRPQTRAIVLEHLLSDAITAVEEAMQCAVALGDVGGVEASPDAFALACDVSADGLGAMPAWLLADGDLLKRIADCISSPQDTADVQVCPDIRFSCQVLGPSLRISRDELEACRVGDGLLLQAPQPFFGARSIVIAGQFLARVSQSDTKLTLQSNLSHLCNKDSQIMENSAPLSAQDRSNLTVSLDVTLAEMEMPLSELEVLAAGSVISLADSFPSDVGITANGVPFGRAELVQVGNQIALRFTQIG